MAPVCKGEGKTNPSFGSPPVVLPALHGHRSLPPVSDVTTLPQEQIFSPMRVRFSMCRR